MTQKVSGGKQFGGDISLMLLLSDWLLNTAGRHWVGHFFFTYCNKFCIICLVISGN